MTRLVGPQMELDSGLIATKTRGASSKKIIKRGSYLTLLQSDFIFSEEVESDLPRDVSVTCAVPTMPEVSVKASVINS